MCNISKDFLVDNMEETGSYGSVYDFSADDYDITDVADNLDIYEYLMAKNNIT